MKQILLKIVKNQRLTQDVMEMVLQGDVSEITAPGQFINIKINGLFLRRPISVCDLSANSVKIIYKIVGEGTQRMSLMGEGEILDVLIGLGNGYNIQPSGENPLLIGGGVGLPPMYYLAKQLLKQGKNVTVIMGFNTENEIFYKKEFEDLGVNLLITTVDGSCGEKGYVTNAMKNVDYSYVYACGPEPMLKAVYMCSSTSGQFSFEERMGCGFGACMGCSCKTLYGNKRICKDGPVLTKEEIIWETQK